MLTVNLQGMSAEAAKGYYDNPVILGELAREWGIEGSTSKEYFDRLCDNRHPITGAQLSPRMLDNRIAGYDITGSVPKPVSLVFLHEKLAYDDDRIRNTVNDSLKWIAGVIEKDIAVRVHDGEDYDRVTGKGIYALVPHLDSRPDPKTGIPSIQVHGHLFYFNLTKDNDRILAAQFGPIKGKADYYMNLWHNDLAHRMKDLGFGIEQDGKVGFGLKGVPRDMVMDHSPRRKTILKARDAIAEKSHVTDPGALQAKLALSTRMGKDKSFTEQDLFKVWDSQLSLQDRRILAGAHGRKGWETTNEAALHYGLDDRLRCKIRVPEHKVLGSALNYGVGSVSVDGLRGTYHGKGVVLRDGYLTTKERLEQEGRIIDFAREGRGTMRPLVAQISSPMPDGRAGVTGEIRDLGYSVESTQGRLSPSNGHANPATPPLSAQEKSRSEERQFMKHPRNATSPNIAADHSARSTEQQAIYSHILNSPDQMILVSGEAKPLQHDKLIWLEQPTIDDLDRSCAHAKANNLRVVLNDPKPVADSGEMFYQLRQHLPVGKKTKGSMYEVKESVNKGDISKAYDILKGLERVKHDIRADAISRIAVTYCGSRHPVLLVAPNGEISGAFTRDIRSLYRQQGKLGPDHDIETLVPLHWPDNKKADVYQYTGEEVIQFNRLIGPFKPGQRIGAAKYLTEIGKIRPGNYEVFTRSKAQLAEGDRIYTTHPGKSLPDERGVRHRINAGNEYTVQSITDEAIQLDNGWAIPKAYGHIRHAYVNGSPAGKDTALVVADTAKDVLAAIKEHGKQRLTIYTKATDAEIRQAAKPAPKPQRKQTKSRASVLMRQAADEFMEMLQDQTSGSRDRTKEHVR